ncbi:DUF3889 domain-containing protein [Paenibacillus sp. BSR1-1]|uniref:DUF3889 domain-containing protein n=1 Tax=Paenibacillus sp. BSR1-1 TaxID=3020845 RepID=UPI0025B081E7|nr:DUF3889 domain-containing protein [Paenibacillus sp. BSR1-1]MDN3018806.1 DUF3889 domain-containing protein [Paenibacillus sp. BSR1-1]
MRKFLAGLFIMLCFLVYVNLQGEAQKPDYEKFGRIAITVVQADFPGAPIKDYEYLGRKKIDAAKVEDGFRFKVQENNQNFFVIVRVSHDATNNKVLNITVENQKQ